MSNENRKVDDLNRFEAIIELLFGDQIRKYDDLIEQMNEQIKKLEKQLLENKKDYNNKLQLLSSEIAGNIQNLDRAVSEKVKTNQKGNDERLNKLSQEKVNKKVLAEKLGLLINAVTK